MRLAICLAALPLLGCPGCSKTPSAADCDAAAANVQELNKQHTREKLGMSEKQGEDAPGREEWDRAVIAEISRKCQDPTQGWSTRKVACARQAATIDEYKRCE